MRDRAAPLRFLIVCLSLLLPAVGSATTPTPSVTPTGPLGRLTVHVAAQPGTCTGTVRDVTVFLQPAGIGAITGGVDGTATFTVPPADYTLSVRPPCTDLVCWSEQVVAVTAGEQSVILCPLAGPPTQTPTATPTVTPQPTGSLGEKTTTLHAFNLVSGASIAGATVDCTGPRVARHGVTDAAGAFDCTLELRDSDTVLTVVSAPGFAERRRGYSGTDLWTNDKVLQFGLIPDGLCGGDCDGDHAVGIDELIHVVVLALATGTTDSCALADIDGDGRVAVNDVVLGVTLALNGCPIE